MDKPKEKTKRTPRGDSIGTKIDKLSELVESETKRIHKLETKFWVFIFLIVGLPIIVFFFRYVPVLTNLGRVQSELSTYVKQQSQEIPSEYRKDIKRIMRESYQATAESIRSRQIATTADARLRLSQLLQAKILSLNRLTNNPKESTKIIQAIKPLSDAIGDRLAADVENRKMNDNLEDVEKAFSEIAEGFR
ncbi:MAG: hypothetical protein LBU34_15655 [Planctomycetaceae bacterium]|jgi:hypothetical protein|nr:hypothetical protein [Planctomycetaceae bacterium]